MSFIQSLIEKYIENYRRQRSWQKLATVLAAVVVFCTTYALILPAITWEKQLICEQPEHVHTDACYEEIDLSEIAELATDSEEYGKIVFATDSNATTAKVLVCEIPEHTHTEACFDAPPAVKTQWLCGMEQHVHDESCYFEDGSLKCTLQEHVHTEECDCIIMDDVTPIEDATLSELEDVTLSELEDATLSEIDLIDQMLTAEAEDGIQFTAEGFMPDGAELVVQALNDEEKESISENVDDIPTQAKAYAYDIKIMLDGEEYKCDDSIRISMTGIEVSDEERVHGYHLPDVDKDNIDQLATATASETVKVEEVGVIQVADEVIFDTEEFSVYYFTVDFTVDFKYNDEQYSIDGHSDGISLSEVMYRLGVRVDVPADDADFDDATDSDADYELASGSDAEFDFPTLSARELGVESITWEGEAEPYLIVSEIEDDWWLAPTGEPFTVSGTLTLYFEDGSTEVISVEDATTYNLYYGDEFKHSGGTPRQFGDCTVNIHGTVQIKDEVRITGACKIVLASDFGQGTSSSKNNYAEVVDGKKVALKYVGTGDRYIRTYGNDVSLTIGGNSDQPFVIDGGSLSGRSNDESLIRWGYGSSWTDPGSNYNCPMTLTNVVFQNVKCTKKYVGDLRQTGGAAIIFCNRSGAINMTDVTFDNCWHTTNGAAIYFYNPVGSWGSSGTVTCTMTDCTIENCSTGNDGIEPYGGTIKTTGSAKLNLVLNNCTFKNNNCNPSAGAIFWNVASGNGTVTANDCTFSNNTAASSGGAIVNQGVLEINRCTFTGNKATDGGAIHQSVYGGGSGRTSQKQKTSLYISEGTMISDNTATGNGGGVAFKASDGEVARGMVLSLVLDGGVIKNNSAKNGGGIYFSKASDAKYDTSIDLNSGSINGNTATGNGGGIYFQRNQGDGYVATINITAGGIQGNTAANSGGGIYSDQTCIDTHEAVGNAIALKLTENSAKYGAGIYVNGISSETTFQGNNYVEDNTAANGSGGGVYIAGGAKFDLQNGLIRNNRATGVKTGSATAYDNASRTLGTGGGIYVEKGTLKVGKEVQEQYLDPETHQIKTRTNILTGVYKNEADFAADDVYAAGTNGTTITLRDPSDDGKILLVKDGTGTVFDKNVNWIEDYLPGDTQYASKWTGHHSENKGRFRELTDAQDAQIMEFAEVKKTNNFICATIGPDKMYKIEYYAPDGTTVIGNTFAFKGDEAIVESIEYGGKTYDVWTSQPGGIGKLYRSGDSVLMTKDIKVYSSDTPPTPTEYELDILTVETGGSEAPLPGAVFNICHYEEGEWKPIPGGENLKTDENGLIHFGGDLAVGEIYQLIEIKAPGGYEIGDKISYFKTLVVTEPAVSMTTTMCTDTGETMNYQYVSAQYRERAVITVSNKAAGGPPLPTTGGCGRDIIYILGLLLLVGGATGLAVRKSKRKRRSG